MICAHKIKMKEYYFVGHSFLYFVPDSSSLEGPLRTVLATGGPRAGYKFCLAALFKKILLK